MNFVPKTIFGGMRKFQPERSKESDPFDGSEAIAWSVNRQDPCLALKWTREPKPSIFNIKGDTSCFVLNSVNLNDSRINQDEEMVLLYN